MTTEDDAFPPGAFAVLLSISRLLGGRVEDGTVTGTFDGWSVSYSHYKSDPPYTVIRVELDAGFPLFIKLHRPWRGDVVPEEMTFKATFSGVIAPLDIAEHVFDRAICDRFAALGRELDLETEANELRFELRGWLEEPTAAADLVRLITFVLARVPDAQSRANAVAMAQTGLYRPHLPDQSTAREREIDAARRMASGKAFELPSVAPTGAVTAPFWVLTVLVERFRRLFRRPR